MLNSFSCMEKQTSAVRQSCRRTSWAIQFENSLILNNILSHAALSLNTVYNHIFIMFYNNNINSNNNNSNSYNDNDNDNDNDNNDNNNTNNNNNNNNK